MIYHLLPDTLNNRDANDLINRDINHDSIAGYYRLMLELAESIAVGYVKKHGNLEQLISQTGKEVDYIG